MLLLLLLLRFGFVVCSCFLSFTDLPPLWQEQSDTRVTSHPGLRSSQGPTISTYAFTNQTVATLVMESSLIIDVRMVSGHYGNHDDLIRILELIVAVDHFCFALFDSLRNGVGIDAGHVSFWTLNPGATSVLRVGKDHGVSVGHDYLI